MKDSKIPAGIASVLAGEKRWCVELGDSLRMLRDLPDECVDACITDPPYSSGGQFRGDRASDTGTKYIGSSVSDETMTARPNFAGDNRDQRSFGYWCTLWMSELLRITKPGSTFLCFTDWRQLPMVTDVVQAGGWVWRGLVPWDKGEGTRPNSGGFRSQCEYIVWATNGAREMTEEIANTYLPGSFRVPVKHTEKLHQTGKPLDLMKRLCELVPKDGIILDPFAGSASTGLAALLMGRRTILIEKTPAYAKVSRDRMEHGEKLL